MFDAQLGVYLLEIWFQYAGVFFLVALDIFDRGLPISQGQGTLH